MKKGKLILTGVLALLLPIVGMLLLLGCSTQQTSTNTTTPASTSVTSTTAPTKTLKIGYEAFFQSDISLDTLHTIQLLVDLDNKNGGIKIGGDAYKIQLIAYDSQETQAGETAAINRLVFEDKVKFIIGEGIAAASWLPITEQNKVLVFSQTVLPQTALNTNLHYSYNANFNNALNSILSGWYAQAYPDLVKNMVVALPDNQMGHMIEMFDAGTWKSFGVTPKIIYFPAATQDFSSVATKVMTLNPTTFHAITGSAVTDSLVYNAVYQAGYKGQFFTTASSSATVLAKTLLPGTLDLYMCGAYPTEFDPPLTQAAKDFKDAWIAKYGSWTDPNVVYGVAYLALTTALEQAGSTDSDSVAAVLNNGMKFSTPVGNGQMMSRPDLGNTRTVDSIAEFYVKKVQNGKPILVATIPIDEGLKYFALGNPPLPPGATPPGGPPAGGPPPGGTP